MKTDRFDLEQCIMNCWNITDDLDVVSTRQELEALKLIYNLKFEKLFETFSECISNKSI